VPAGPGVFYVFRDTAVKESFVAARYRRTPSAHYQRRSDVLYERYKEILDPLASFYGLRGRLPDRFEIQVGEELCKHLGSIKNAFNVVRRVTGGEHWDKISEERRQDFLVYLALSKFGKRPPISSLPRDIQLDVRAFFSTYTRACSLADQLLFSAGDMNKIRQACLAAPVGKLTPGSLYLHVSALASLPPVLRVYEGCARAYIGSVDDANIVKLKYLWPQVSYLAYPDFDTDPHPVLLASLIIPLRPPGLKYRDYKESTNPPILHRKEAFLAESHPLREKFARLTRQEERYGLYENTSTIGNRSGWETALRDKGVTLRGHKLTKLKAAPRAE